MSVPYLGDIQEDATVSFLWNTFDAMGASVTRATNGTVKVYRIDDGTDCTGTSVTDTEDTPATGVHTCIVDTSDNANYAAGHDYAVWVEGAVIDGQTVNACLALFSIENRMTTELIADAVCDEALGDHTAAGTLGKAVSDILDDVQADEGHSVKITHHSTD